MWKRVRSISSVILLAVILFIGTSYSQTGTTVHFAWSAPTTGSPVVLYNFSIMSDSTAVPVVVSSTSLLWTHYSMPTGLWYVRVQGKDALDRVGPWSWALVWNDAGAPGGCTGLKWIKI